MVHWQAVALYTEQEEMQKKHKLKSGKGDGSTNEVDQWTNSYQKSKQTLPVALVSWLLCSETPCVTLVLS